MNLHCNSIASGLQRWGKCHRVGSSWPSASSNINRTPIIIVISAIVICTITQVKKNSFIQLQLRSREKKSKENRLRFDNTDSSLVKLKRNEEQEKKNKEKIPIVDLPTFPWYYCVVDRRILCIRMSVCLLSLGERLQPPALYRCSVSVFHLLSFPARVDIKDDCVSNCPHRKNGDDSDESDSEKISLRISWRERYLRKRRNKKKRR